MNRLIKGARRVASSLRGGAQTTRTDRAFPPDFDPTVISMARRVKPFTMTSPERIHALVNAVEYIVRNAIPGDFVECGVWRGGSMMAVAETLLRLDAGSRRLHLFDTFEGMPAPSDRDRNLRGEAASRLLATSERESAWVWAVAQFDDVRQNMRSTGYPSELIRYVQGRVEETIPSEAPDQIAMLRLDTDWYESTKHEMVHLFPRLAPGGVLIVDDYGHWAGAREAVDEYIAEQGIPLLLCRIDYTGRIAVKQ